MKKRMNKSKLIALPATALIALALLISGTFGLTNNFNLTTWTKLSPALVKGEIAPEALAGFNSQLLLNKNQPSADSDTPNDKQETVSTQEDLPGMPADADLTLSILNDDARYISGAVIMKRGETLQLKAATTRNNGVITMAQWMIYEDKNLNGWYLFQPYVNGDISRADIKVEDAAPDGDLCIVIIGYDADNFAYIPIIVIPDEAVAFAAGADGGNYCDMGDNTFREIVVEYGDSPQTTIVSIEDYICGGFDRLANTSDDRVDVISSGGRKYLGPNADASYQKAGEDQLLGTSDDIIVVQKDVSRPISPDNEAELNDNTAEPASDLYLTTNQWRVPPKMDDQGTMTASGYIFVKPGTGFEITGHPSDASIYDLLYLAELEKALAQGQSSTDYVPWSKPGLTIAEVGASTVRISIAENVANWETYGIALVSAANDKLTYDQIIVLPTSIQDVVIDSDKIYFDFGGNSFQELVIANGTVDLADPFSAGIDQKPGTGDDRSDFIVSGGVRYLGPNPNNTYQKAGPDGKLGTADDELVVKVDPSREIGPDNETAANTNPTPVATATATPAATATPVATATPAATATATPAATATATPAATATATPAASASATPGATASPTPAATASPTPGATATPTPTPIITSTPTPTPRPTVTNRPTPTNRPTSAPSYNQRPVTGYQVIQAIVRHTVSFWQRFFYSIIR